MEKIKKDFLIYTAFLLSRGIIVAGKVLEAYSEGDVIISREDLHRIKQIVASDTNFAEAGENFVKYLKHLMANETDHLKRHDLKLMYDLISNLKSNVNFSPISMN